MTLNVIIPTNYLVEALFCFLVWRWVSPTAVERESPQIWRSKCVCESVKSTGAAGRENSNQTDGMMEWCFQVIPENRATDGNDICVSKSILVEHFTMCKYICFILFCFSLDMLAFLFLGKKMDAILSICLPVLDMVTRPRLQHKLHTGNLLMDTSCQAGKAILGWWGREWWVLTKSISMAMKKHACPFTYDTHVSLCLCYTHVTAEHACFQGGGRQRNRSPRYWPLTCVLISRWWACRRHHMAHITVLMSPSFIHSPAPLPNAHTHTHS